MHEHTLCWKHAQNHPDEVLMTLGAVCLQARNMLAQHEFTLAEARTLVKTVVHVRSLLAEWADAESSLGKNVQLIAAIRDMKKKYLNLEGRIKERRNDLIAK